MVVWSRRGGAEAMPVKSCAVCATEFWARWRNTPPVCDTCAGHVLICPGCWKVTAHSDPAQLSLFSARGLEPLGVRPLSVLLAGHFANNVPRNFDPQSHLDALLTTEPAHHPVSVPPWPRRASRAERMKYPYH